MPVERLVVHNEHVYLVPESLPDLVGLCVVCAGLRLGTAKPGRFELSHALVMALFPDDARLVLLKLDAAERYLRGETFADDGPDGWVLIDVNGWPLGWADASTAWSRTFIPKDCAGYKVEQSVISPRCWLDRQALRSRWVGSAVCCRH